MGTNRMENASYWTHYHLTGWTAENALGIYTDLNRAMADANWLVDQWLEGHYNHLSKIHTLGEDGHFVIVAYHRPEWLESVNPKWAYSVSVNPCAMECDEDPEELNHIYGQADCSCFYCDDQFRHLAPVMPVEKEGN